MNEKSSSIVISYWKLGVSLFEELLLIWLNRDHHSYFHLYIRLLLLLLLIAFHCFFQDWGFHFMHYFVMVKQNKNPARIFFHMSVEKHIIYQYTSCQVDILIINRILIQWHWCLELCGLRPSYCWMIRNHLHLSMTDPQGLTMSFSFQR